MCVYCRTSRILCAQFFAVLLSLTPLPVAASVELEIQDIIDGTLTGEDAGLLRADSLAEEIVALLYERRQYRPAWQNRDMAIRVLELIGASETEGLRPEDYDYGQLLDLFSHAEKAGPGQQRVRAQFDILLSNAVLLYARHLIEGKVNPGPLEYSWNYSRRDFQAESVVEKVNQAIDEQSVVSQLAALAPHSWFYGQLKQALAFYRKLQQDSPFSPIPATSVHRPGDSHSEVTGVRRRLSELDFFHSPEPQRQLFDEDLEQAVKHFQSLHGLAPDGIVGAGTFAALNVPWSQRIDQLRINLDRIRWVQDDVSDNFVVVNIPGYELYYIKDENLVWKTEVVAGAITTETPMFRSTIKYLVFNPDWTVPRSIIGRSLYGKFAANPAYIKESNYKLFDSGGAEVDALQLDWSQLGPDKFPYRVVQQPGPDNALGRVKFMFPNKHAIYLHDTPHRELFGRSARAFSAGCIRVQYPLELAEILLADADLWPRQTIDEVVAGRDLKVVHLANPVDVLLMYWTASATREGRVKFHPDIYSRDAAVLVRLNAAVDWLDD
jgi:murein L,D-transpeptidase YcbB/YkuD